MKAIVTGDAERVVNSFGDLPPGAHVAVSASPTQLPDSGLALRLAGFEIRDTIAHIVGDYIVWWILARKPLDGTVAANVLAHGVGGLNIDASRVPGEPIEIHARTSNITGANSMSGTSTGSTGTGEFRTDGRFPANVLLDEHAAKEMDRQSGVSVSRERKHRDSHCGKYGTAAYGDYGIAAYDRGINDSGGASRFFPVLDEDGAENWIRKLIDPDCPE